MTGRHEVPPFPHTVPVLRVRHLIPRVTVLDPADGSRWLPYLSRAVTVGGRHYAHCARCAAQGVAQ